MEDSLNNTSGRHEVLRAKLVELSKEEFFDHEGMSTDYPSKVRKAFTDFSNELGVIMQGGNIYDMDETALNKFIEKVDELKFLLSKI
jgi:hypothetical protein